MIIGMSLLLKNKIRAGDCGMDYESYMTGTCSWRKKIGIDEDTRMTQYGDIVIIKCFSYGKNIFDRGETSGTRVSAKAFVVTEDVSTGDEINGQIVKSADDIPEFDSSIPLRECLTWNT